MNCKLITENDCAISAVLSCSPAEFLIINKVISRCSTNEDFAESDRKTMALMGKAMMNFEQVEVADTQQTTSTPYCVNTSSVCKVDTPQTEQMKTADYCDICKQDMCKDCIADATNPYCVPSHYEINYEPKDEPTISKMKQVETMSCAECKHRPIGAEICEEPCHYEPQTDWHYDEQDATWYPYKHEDEPQTNKEIVLDPSFAELSDEQFVKAMKLIEPQTDLSTEEFVEGMKNLKMEVKQTDCGWK